MYIKTIKLAPLALSIAIFTNQTFAENKTSKPHAAPRVYYKPVSVVSSPKSSGQTIGIYQRAQIGKDGGYGTFTRKGQTLSQTVLEHNPTSAEVSGVTDQATIGYIPNTNPGAGASTYLGLYPYSAPLTIQKKTAVNKSSMKMQKAKYTQAK